MSPEEELAVENDVEGIQLTITQARHSVRLGEALNRLQQSPDFQAVITQNYLKDQASRLGHLLSDPAMQTKQKRKAVIKDIEAIGTFLSYLQNVNRQALMAAEAIRVNEQELQNIETERAQ